MSETSDLTLTPPPTPPMPNDSAARSPTGEILEPSQIAANQTAAPIPPSPTPSPPAASPPTSTPKPPEAPKPSDAPYAAFTAPEGYTLDPKAIEAATPIFKELGLTQDQAQKLVEFHSKAMIDAAKAPESAYATVRTEWKAAIDADPTIKAATADGKTGLDAVKIGIAKTLNALGDPQLTADFKAAMDLTGAGDNPAFIKAMWKLSAFITEGKPVTPGGPSPHGQTPPNTGARPTPAASLYPNLPQ